MKKAVALFRNVRFDYVTVHPADMGLTDLIRISEVMEIDFPMLDIDEAEIACAKLKDARATLEKEIQAIDTLIMSAGEKS
jgi:hypothetical protein